VVARGVGKETFDTSDRFGRGPHAGHAGEVSYIRRAEGVEPGRVLVQDIGPGTNKGVSMLVYLTVSGPFSEKELSPNTHCANPDPEIDDAPRRHSGQ
jgi:hypothetical protein